MNILTNLLLIVGGLAVMYYGWYILRNHPAGFSKENIGRSLCTLGVLTLIIIGVIALCIMMLKS